MTPRVTVVTPAHNSAATLRETVDSILAQSLSDLEVVIADDASTDGTRDVVSAVADPRVRLVRSERNLGPGGARNLALSQARGAFVALLDADDRWAPDYLERQLALFDRESERRADVGIVACDAWLIVDGAVSERRYYDLVPPVAELDLTRMLRGNAIFISALVPRTVGEEVGWFDAQLFGTEDYDLWLRILETGRRAVLQREPLAEYRVHAASVSSNMPRMARNYRAVYERALARGRLTEPQRRLARRQVRYYRALELVAEAASGPGTPAVKARALVRHTPLLVRVALSSPGRWRSWLRTLRGGVPVGSP